MSSIEEYDRAIENFCKDNPNKTIYLAGEISHPGISDLDFIVVDHKPQVSKEVLPFLMGGNVLISPKFLFKKIRLLENFKLKFLQGDLEDFEEPPEVFSIIEIIEWLPERILKCERMLEDKSFSHPLLLHKSIVRSIEKISNLTGIKYDHITSNYARINSNVIDSKIIIRDALHHSNLAWNDFSIYVADNHLIKGDVEGSVQINDYYTFNCKYNILMLYLKKMSMQKGILSEKLSKRINIETKEVFFNEELEKFSLERWDLLDRNFQWFLSKGFNKGMIKYGWFLQ